MRKKNRMIWAVVIGCLVLVNAGCGSRPGLYVEQEDSAAEDPVQDGASGEASGSSGSVDGSGTAAEEIYVQVSGAVVNPGVYKLPVGSRIFEAVERAGGVLETADLSMLNQAQILSDGQMVYIYAVGEQRSGQELGSMEPDDGRINLNTATVNELMTLPGIGQSKAESIISWREEHGAFANIEELMNITGIKEGVFSKIKDHIKVN